MDGSERGAFWCHQFAKTEHSLLVQRNHRRFLWDLPMMFRREEGPRQDRVIVAAGLGTEVGPLEVFACSFKRRGALCHRTANHLTRLAFVVPQGPPLHLRHIMFPKHLDSLMLCTPLPILLLYTTDVITGAPMASGARKAKQLSFYGTDGPQMPTFFRIPDLI